MFNSGIIRLYVYYLTHIITNKITVRNFIIKLIIYIGNNSHHESKFSVWYFVINHYLSVSWQRKYHENFSSKILDINEKFYDND